MKPLSFVGKIPASKSMMNRLLIAKSYAGNAIQIEGESDCEDVTLMRAALKRMNSIGALDAGSAGAVLRFLALRVSRQPGHHRIEGRARLFSRPQDELLKILAQVGVAAEITDGALELKSEGWKLQGDTLMASSARSSQFASGILLNAWNLPFDLYVSLGGGRVSEGYWRMSLRLAQRMGMKIDFWDSDFRVARGQKPLPGTYRSEIDMSSAFAVAAVAAVNGQATFLDFPRESLQPDASFTQILGAMGAKVHWINSTSLQVARGPGLRGVAVDLKTTPDLFPVLAVLCALAEGESDLFGAPHLVHKESDRLKRTAELVRALGRGVEVKDDGIKIFGQKGTPAPFDFSTDQDHRLAFALAVAQAAGWPIKILGPEVVNKSFPEFWKILGWTP